MLSPSIFRFASLDPSNRSFPLTFPISLSDRRICYSRQPGLSDARAVKNFFPAIRPSAVRIIQNRVASKRRAGCLKVKEFLGKPCNDIRRVMKGMQFSFESFLFRISKVLLFPKEVNKISEIILLFSSLYKYYIQTRISQALISVGLSSPPACDE